MDIGGHDIVFKDHGTPSALLNVAAVIWMQWEDAVFHDGAGHVHEYMDLPADTTELFAYRDRAALDSWSREGLTEANANAMIHAIIGETGLTVVVNDPDEPEARALLTTLRTVLM